MLPTEPQVRGPHLRLALWLGLAGILATLALSPYLIALIPLKLAASPLPLWVLLPALLEGSEAYAFADAGQVRFKSRFGLPEQSQGLASAGGGVRLSIGGHTLLGLEAARALRDIEPLTPGGHGWRGVFTIKTVY